MSISADHPMFDFYRAFVEGRNEFFEPSDTDLDPSARELGLVAGLEHPQSAATMLDESEGNICQIRSTDEIAGLILKLADEISRNYISDAPLLILGVAEGYSRFMAELVRKLDDRISIEVGFIEAPSETIENRLDEVGDIQVSPHLSLAGRNVLLVQDTLFTGETLHRVIARLYLLEPDSLKACVLIDRRFDGRPHIPEVRYRGLFVEKGSVVGYGMGEQPSLRSLPYIGIVQDDEFIEAL